MSIRSDISIDWEVSPRIITVDKPSIEATMQDLYDTLRDAEIIQVDENYIVSGAGKEPLGGGVVVGLTLTLNNALIAFEARTGPTYIQCRISGGNLVANDNAGDPVNSSVSPTAFTQVVQANSSSATLQELDAIQFSSYNGGVSIDQVDGEDGDEYPYGTQRQPVKTLDSLVIVRANQGLPRIAYVLGDLDITAAVPSMAEYTFIGQGIDRTIIDITGAADVLDCAYFDAEITGTLDGNSRLEDCMISNLIYIKGFVKQCVLSAGTITLGGGETLQFLDCWSGEPGTTTPVIDMGGSGQALSLRNYNGGIKLQNKSGVDKISIDLNSGQCILDNTVTNGEIVARGVGKLIDTGGNTIPTGTWNGVTITNETLNPDHISEHVWSLDMTGNTGAGSFGGAIDDLLSAGGSLTPEQSQQLEDIFNSTDKKLLTKALWLALK